MADAALTNQRIAWAWEQGVEAAQLLEAIRADPERLYSNEGAKCAQRAQDELWGAAFAVRQLTTHIAMLPSYMGRPHFTLDLANALDHINAMRETLAAMTAMGRGTRPPDDLTDDDWELFAGIVEACQNGDFPPARALELQLHEQNEATRRFDWISHACYYVRYHIPAIARL